MTDEFKRGDRVRIINDRGWAGVCCTVLEDCGDGEYRLLPDRGSVYAFDGSPLKERYIDFDAGTWHFLNLEPIHPKKPNKIVIPDGPAPEWAVRRMAELSPLWSAGVMGDHPVGIIASHLVAMLEEEPIDEDLIEARKICEVGKSRNSEVTVDFLSGAHDESFSVQAVLAAIKRGRELGKAGDV